MMLLKIGRDTNHLKNYSMEIKEL